MNSKLLTFIAFFLFLISSSTASITISDLSTSTVEPGGEFTVKATINNPDLESKTYKPLTLDLPEGLKVVERPEEGLKELCASCSDERIFKINVDAAVDSGTYLIDIQPDEKYDQGYGQEEEFTITVDGEANLVTKLERPEIILGEEKEALLQIENIGTDTASEVVIRPENTGITFQPGTLIVGEINEGEIYSENLTVHLSESLSSGVHNTAIDLRYKDETNQKTSSSQVSVKALEDSEIIISSTEFDDMVVGQKSSAVIELENQGPGEAENVSTTLNCQNASLKTNRAFIGQLEDEESVPTVFEIKPTEKDIKCSMEIRYSDSSEKQLTETFGITAEPRNLPIYPISAVIVLIAVTGVYVIRR